MPTLLKPPRLRLTRNTTFACLAMILVSLFSAPPGHAQFGGDAITSGCVFHASLSGPVDWGNYYLEWDPEPVKSPLVRSKQEVLTQPAATANKPDPFAAQAESSAAVRGDQFSPGDMDKRGSKTKITGSQASG